MVKVNFKIFAICATAVLLSAYSVLAQQSVSTEKKSLIQEIRILTGMQNLIAKTEVSSTNIGDALTSLVEKDRELTDDQRQELKKVAFEAKERLEKQMREFSEDKTISAQLFEEVFIQLYDTNFTESELREMVVFYRTPTGQKAAKFLLGLSNKVGKAYGQAFSQRFKDFVTLKLQEEAELLKRKIKEVKNKKLEA